ncbi:hypothetical protein HK099_000152 [Clydaea vesicula]|uniref:Uncharacterized protein n=1 Tax=Clydaea vesicula TaxID=447962 RepID=A0AAD5U4P6_9FUNG|nr:hypothetical protein HK099_000152 [Clydaea vesicula]
MSGKTTTGLTKDEAFNSILLFLIAIWNVILFVREARLTQLEVVTRIETVIENLRESKSLTVREYIKIPDTLPTVAVAHVLRDEQIYTVPLSMLVESDILLMTFGEASPYRLVNVPPPGVEINPELPEFILEKNEVLSQNLQRSFPYGESQGKMYFKLLETPLLFSLKAALDKKRPETVIVWRLRKLNRLLVTRVIWVLLGTSLVINLIRFFLEIATNDYQLNQQSKTLVVVMQLLLNMQANSHSSLGLPTMLLIARSYGNAQIICLLEELQNSTNAHFEDKDDIDEFDPAPPPTLQIATSWGILLPSLVLTPTEGPIAKKFWDQLIRFDVDFLARTTGLIESLADTTVICSIDREGTLSKVGCSLCNCFD